jgi:MYXO-CTERM domain-containing protein
VAIVGAGAAMLGGRMGVSPIGTIPETRAAALAPADRSVDARLLLVGADGHDGALQAMRSQLEFVGIAYTEVNGSALAGTALTDSPSHGLYNGVILTSCTGAGAPDLAAMSPLAAYLATFGVRSACLSVAPDSSFGFGPAEVIDTRSSPLTLSYTPAGASVFGWYAAPTPVDVSGVTATMAAATDGATTPLLVDGAGRAGVAVHVFADGREVLLLSFDQAPGAPHSRQLLLGVASWTARGVFVGEPGAFFGAQADDLFLGTVLHDGTTFRMGGDDLRNAARWQAQARAGTIGGSLTLTLPFNGVEVRDDDPLTQAARDVGRQFQWVSHTFDHHRLDSADYARMTQELTSNDAVMTKYGFGPYDRSSLVTPDVSGLMNAEVMRAAYDFGIRQVVCDASYAGCDPPVPNTAIDDPVGGTLLMIPRVATGLYAAVSTPADWVAEYNTLNQAASGRALAYDEIVDKESEALLGHLLAGDLTPWMFHQANLRAYDGTHTLLTNLLDKLLEKYARLRVLPLVTLSMSDVAARMRARTGLQAAGVVATIGPGQTITVRAANAARVTITGARAPDARTYGAIVISTIDVPAGGTVTVPLAEAGGTDAGGTPGASPGQNLPGGSGGCGCALGPGSSPHAGSGAVALLAALGLAARRGRRRGRASTAV